MNWFFAVTFVCGILIGSIIAYASSRGFFANTTTWKRYFYPPIPTIFSSLGLILLVYSLSVTDRKGAFFGAFYFIVFFPSYVFHKHAKFSIFHRLCLLVVGVLGYYMFGLSLLGILLLIGGVIALVDAIYQIIRRKPLSLKPSL